MQKKIIKKLIKIVGKDHCSTAVEDLHCYSYDGSKKTYLPDVIIFPESAKQISKILKYANLYKLPVTPRGAGTGMTGGALPVQGGVVLVMSRMKKIIEIDKDNLIGIIEPGVITGEYQQALKKEKLFYPPDPASLKFCSIGGNAAECAGGPSAVKYGVTKDYIIGLEVVTPTGDIIKTGSRTEKNVVGYDLTRLFIGSEGTLGVITKITTRLLALPDCKKTFQIASSSLKKLTSFVGTILSNNIAPCTLEYIDQTALSIIPPTLNTCTDENIEALLILELDGFEQDVIAQKQRLLSLVDKFGFAITEAKTSTDEQNIWQARRSISPSAFKLKPNKISEDVVVPRSRISDLVGYTEKLGKKYGITILTFGHAGDGNIHVNIMHDLSDKEETSKCKLAREELFRYVISLSGALSGEHGIGITKSPFLHFELDSATIKTMKGIKKLFDPKGIMNPGKIFID